MRLVSLIAFLLALAAAAPALALEARVNDEANTRWIEVTGEGAVAAAPDFARITLGVTTTAPNAGDAVAANAKAASALVSTIKAEGVAPADIQTSNLSISPLFSQPPRGGSGAPAIEGYSVNNNVTVTVRDIPHLGALLDKAVSAGANSVYGVAFGHSDPSALLDKARPLAVADARRKAEIYARADGAKIGRLITLTEGTESRPPIGFARAYASSAAVPTPIEAGEDKLTVSVTARFEFTQ